MSYSRILPTLLLLIGLVGGRLEAQPCAGPHDAPVMSFTPTPGLMTSPGTLGTATLLRDGRVLVTGGFTWTPAGGYQSLATAQVFDPKAGTFSPTLPMSTKRYGHQAVLLRSGKVLILGGSDLSRPSGLRMLDSAEIYDPRTGTFTVTGSMTISRLQTTAVLLHDGTVLVAGGNGWVGDLGAPQTAEIYDPESGKFTATGSMMERRRHHQATLLKDGRVLITGGDHLRAEDDFLLSMNTAEVYDPKSGTFSSTGNMALTRTYHSATALHDGKVLLVGGINVQGGDLYSSPDIAASELYDPRTGTFSTVGNLGFARDSHTATLLDEGLVLITGGMDTASVSFYASAELYDPHSGLFTPTAPLLQPREGHSAVLLRGGQVLIVGGDNANPPISQAELFALEHDFRH